MLRILAFFPAAIPVVFTSAFAYAQGQLPQAPPMRAMPAISFYNLLISIVYGILGMALLIIGYYVFELVTPYSAKKELVEDQNVAIGLVVASVILGMAIIIAAAIL